jgi:hypothetical protein
LGIVKGEMTMNQGDNVKIEGKRSKETQDGGDGMRFWQETTYSETGFVRRENRGLQRIAR